MAHLEMKLKPWLAPNFATLEQPPGLKQEGLRELPSIAVKDLPQATLDALAAEWLTNLYAKAEKPRNWTLLAK